MRKFAKTIFAAIAAISLLSSCQNYGDKVSKDFVEVYYKDNITKEQAQQTLELLHPSWNEPGNKKSVQLAKVNDTITFRMVINQEKAKDIPDESYLLVANNLSGTVFKGEPVNVDLTSNSFETIRTLHFQKMDLKEEDYGEKVSTGNIDVYALNGFDVSQANTLARYLDEIDGNESNTKSFQASKNDNGIYTVNMVSDPANSAALDDKEFYNLAALISDNVFNGAPVILQLTSNTFEPYKSFKHKVPE